MVSINMITYNHEPFIAQAIEGVLMQETNFSIELVIGEDFSTDSTRKICEDYAIKYSDIIRLLPSEQNLGMLQNGIRTLRECKGKYIALLDGDDYWTDPLKLQKQVDFLEMNLDYVIHSGSAKILYAKEDVSEVVLGNTSVKTDFVVEDFYTQNNLVTCTVLFRNIVKSYPDSFSTITFGDWFLYVILLHKSKSKVFVSNTVFSVYRVHEAGVMKQLSQIENIDAHFQQIKIMQEYIGYKKKSPQDIKNINTYFKNKLILFLKNDLYVKGFKSFILNIRYCGFHTNLRSYIKLSLKHMIKHRV